MSESLVIRRYAPADQEDLLAVWDSASRGAHGFMPEQFFEEERWHIPNTYLPKAETWVAQADGRMVGFASLIGQEVGALFVAPDMQGRGVGHALLDQARALHGELCVEVFAENQAAYGFYLAYGFCNMPPTVPPDEVHGHRLIRLALSVAGADQLEPVST